MEKSSLRVESNDFYPEVPEYRVATSNKEYWAVIVFISNVLHYHELFNKIERAELSFANKIREFAEVPVNSEFINKAIEDGHFLIHNGKVILSKPDVKF